MPFPPPTLSVNQFQEKLRPLLQGSSPGTVVFDADGTLWSHDVGCMIFDWVLAQGLFKSAAYAPLLAFAQREGLSTRAQDVLGIAREIQVAFYAHRLGGRSAAEMQVWAYVDFTEQEFRSSARAALDTMGHHLTLHDEVLTLADWVRSQGARTIIVSASPQWVVEEATLNFGFASCDVVGGLPLMSTDAEGILRIAPRLAEPLPYGPDKVRAGRRLMGSAEWIAALGDSSFDVEMFREARLAAGIGDKPGMLSGLSELEHGVRLELESPGHRKKLGQLPD